MSYEYIYGDDVMKNLIGKTVTAIHMSDARLVFETDGGLVGYEVEGDCCSYSYLHDFFGVENLLHNGPITESEGVDLDNDDPRFAKPVPAGEVDYTYTQVYGYRLTTVHPTFGEMSSVVSFRNESNGYYGGSLRRLAGEFDIPSDAKNLTTDYVGE